MLFLRRLRAGCLNKLAIVQQKHILSHFWFAKLFNLNTVYREQFHKSIYLLKVTQMKKEIRMFNYFLNGGSS